jgi:pimeloyl-ACP methyl ester carboxylesterase/uncharacterized membrane protein HdeD (DUF308 family)
MATDPRACILHVRYDEGSGPIIVLLHGINSDGGDWRKVIDIIGPEHRCIAVDLLGFGESPKPADIEYTADDHTAALDATLETIGVDKPFLLVGYSLGGDIAIRYASTHPHKLRRLFMLSAPFYLPPEAFSEAGFATQFMQVVIFQRIWKALAGAKKRDSLLYQIVNGEAEEFAKQFLRTDDVATHWDIMSKNLRNCIGRATFVKDLPALTMPTTFALGIRDPIVHPDQTPALKRLKPDMDLVRIVGLSADHFLLVGLPDTVAKEIMKDEVRTLNVRYRAGAVEDVPIVFLHGIQDDPRFWMPVAQALSRRHEVVLVDLLGFGDSPKPMSAKYTLEEHVTALANTITAQFPRGEARLVGHGFGATVALGVAASVPERVSEVVAFSPLLFSDGGLGSEVSEDDRDVASAMSIADSLDEMVRDERGSAAAERFEDRLEPIVRTFKNAVGPLRTEALLRRVADPVRFIAPLDDDRVPVDHISVRVAERDDFALEMPPGTRELPLEDPAAVVLMLDPDAHDEARLAAGLPCPKPRAGLRALREVFESATSTIFWRGLWTLLGGLVILLWPGFPAELVTFAFAIWVAVLGFQTIVGAVGLRRTGKGGWVPWLLLGALSAGIAVFLLIKPEWSMFIIEAVIFVRALYTGIVDIYIARKIAHGPTPKWLLWLEGIVGLAIALFLVFGSNHGVEITKLAVGVYFVVTGFTSVAYALEVQRRTRKRTHAMLDDHRETLRGGARAGAAPAAKG